MNDAFIFWTLDRLKWNFSHSLVPNKQFKGGYLCFQMKNSPVSKKNRFQWICIYTWKKWYSLSLIRFKGWTLLNRKIQLSLCNFFFKFQIIQPISTHHVNAFFQKIYGSYSLPYVPSFYLRIGHFQVTRIFIHLSENNMKMSRKVFLNGSMAYLNVDMTGKLKYRKHGSLNTTLILTRQCVEMAHPIYVRRDVFLRYF